MKLSNQIRCVFHTGGRNPRFFGVRIAGPFD
jgi:hypothetical protein